MEIHLKYTNIPASAEIEAFILEKIGSLEKFIEEIGLKKQGLKETVSAWVEVGKGSLHHQKGKVWYAECQIRLPRKSLRAVSNNYNLRAAIEEVKDEMRHLLEEYLNRQKEKAKEYKG